MILAPSLTEPGRAVAVLRSQGYAVLDAAGACALAGCQPGELHALDASWNDLPPDEHLKDGGRYRQRRHASLVQAMALHLQPVYAAAAAVALLAALGLGGLVGCRCWRASVSSLH